MPASLISERFPIMTSLPDKRRHLSMGRDGIVRMRLSGKVVFAAGCPSEDDDLIAIVQQRAAKPALPRVSMSLDDLIQRHKD